MDQQNDYFLPDFCAARIVFIVVVSAELLAVILTLAQTTHQESIFFTFALLSLHIQWISLCCIAALCKLRSYLSQYSDTKAAVFSFGVILLISGTITQFAWELFLNKGNIYNDFSREHVSFLVRSLSITAIVGAVVLRYLYMRQQWRNNIESLAESRYIALQSRIRPHFLFNSLNTIASLIRTKPDTAENAVEDLADLFRAALTKKEELSNWQDEKTLCEHYLRIEEQRLDERLKVDWQTDAIPTNTLLPPLSLQPLLENAIYHGIEKLAEGGTIIIDGKQESNRIYFKISNPIVNNDSFSKGHQIGQENVKQRLLNVFENDCEFTINTDDECYTINISFPYKTA